MKSLSLKKIGSLSMLIVFIAIFANPIFSLDGPFTDLGNGKIRTGSLRRWQKCSMGQGITTCNSSAAITTDWAGALAYCNSLNLDGETWRLPNVKELQSLVNYGRTSFPIIDVIAFPDTVGAYYWTSTTAMSTGTSPSVGTADPKGYNETASNDNPYRIPINTPYRSMAYIVDFRMGGVIEFPKNNTTKAYVRCVTGP
ncbi:DUF1566 domain-containing protein [Leptospira sp. FAT2]|uniref:Lcl C-terminal domain-containing protein n=1 Tax=Leptospira sanjuanensis TaxID=2879643 RepID=UPI001EE82F86|nr:DUF1566 domain-containing protein [Leptospira sanjuanensis]MCG6192326.1 DUF1566 domain-containing protein [Leptospira sanjuanensis]